MLFLGRGRRLLTADLGTWEIDMGGWWEVYLHLA
jgi:hypothetical protein